MATPRQDPTRSQRGKGAGAPTAYRTWHAKQAYELALLKHTNQEIADIWGINQNTLNTWLHKHPRLREAISNGRDIADAKVARSLVERAMGYSHKAVKIFMPAGASEPIYAPYTEHYPPDTAAASLWLRNRQPAKWRDRQEVDLTLKKDPRELTTDDLLSIIARDPAALEPPTIDHSMGSDDGSDQVDDTQSN
jgi:hypothetical protein